MTRTLRSGFLASVERFPEREALRVGADSLSYQELARRARQVAATLERYAPPDEGRLTAVLGHRHPTAFAGILGALFRGHGYVPLNPAYPPERTRTMFERSECRSLIVDPTAMKVLETLLDTEGPTRVVLLPDAPDVSALRRRWPGHTILGREDLEAPESCVLGETSSEDLAYLLFTSGSTGQPKGVMVAHRNVVRFIDLMTERYGISENDRLSSTFDLTFDLSLFDMFCAWERGACVVVPTLEQKMLPAHYIRQNELTVWFSVPSTGVMMSRLRMLKPGAFETLRWALFCGEALSSDVAARFAEAAPNATLENLYGPTELTIACTLYRWDRNDSAEESWGGIVPIGEPYPGMEALIVDDDLRPVPRGAAGELLMTGPQMVPGYWKDEARTAQAFVCPRGESRIFYRTGDRVRWPEGGPMLYLGRMDNQIKVQGYRVELGEVEAVLREVSGAEVAIAMGWPLTEGGAEGIVGFVGAPEADPDALLAYARERLPRFMQPTTIRLVSNFPLNANGKVDRRALLAELEQEGFE